MLHRRTPWILAIGILMSMPVWWGTRALDSWRLRSALESAKRAIASRQTAEARRVLAWASTRWPGEGEVAYLLGACEQALGDPDAADAAWARVEGIPRSRRTRPCSGPDWP